MKSSVMNVINKITKSPTGNETETRIRTALLGASIFLFFLLFLGHFGTAVATIVITALMCLELSAVFYKSSDADEKKKVLLGVAWLMVFLNLFLPKAGLECLVIAVIGLFSYYLGSADRHEENLRAHFDEFIFTVFILVYVVLFMEFMPLIRRGPNGLKWLMLFFFINWSADIAAYFGGKKYGKQKLYPLISPKKTVEGAIAAIVGAVVVALLFKFIFFRELSFFGAVLTAVFVGFFSQIGDLCESLFKRAYGIKDSGKILPGHGGFLDRFDGVLFTLPIMYLCVRIFA